MSDADLDAIREDLNQASSTLTRLCNGQERWRMSIPAQPDGDPDLILARGLKAADDAVAEVDRRRAHCDGREAALKISGQHIEEYRAEVGRLRDDLADAQRRIDDALDIARDWPSYVTDLFIAALSAGGGNPAEGLIIGYRVRLTNADDDNADWRLFAPEDVQIVRVGPTAGGGGTTEGDSGDVDA